jgi:methyltransferase (TIGR00027 family)
MIDSLYAILIPTALEKLLLTRLNSGDERKSNMDENRASTTALMTAYCRAYHATYASPKIFDDFLADRLFTREEHVTFDRLLAERLPLINPELAASGPDQATALACVMQALGLAVSLSRLRYTEDCLEQAVGQGAQQYVLLGAGLDTFAFRRPDLVNRLQVFEVDRPATQGLKRQRLAMLNMETPTHLHFVPADFATGNLTDAIRNSAYNPQKLSFFSWLGVICYLPREAVLGTLRTIAGLAPRGSAIVFDYTDNDAFIPEKASKQAQAMQASTREVGEPMQTGFDPLTLGDELKSLGFSLEENLHPDGIEARYFQGRADGYHAFAHLHFAKAVVV